jgi:hypothetical protein
VNIANPVFFASSNPGPGVPAWLNDSDAMREESRNALHYFETAADPVLGMYSLELGFRIVHRLEGATLYNSNRSYQGPRDGQPGDVVSLGKTRNMKDGQTGEMLARVLGPEIETPAEYRHYMVYLHTYPVLAD